ncbi:GNAT family N-acetyltransferase [Clostridium sp. P21]|uniref:GNAT family N-acetyltransferase n=1 Tax=Clostridium muellerianum TaxID=2716538 RepID=A0A7Y0EE27_9CLOT|nr:GNAT family N-acetyltransferase [Clostridium muellerianum]NMM61717.1 GNAT family N-acetyltransferase [Clostridium muellerianum]
MKVAYAKNCDFKNWIDLLELVKENFPGLDLKQYENILQQSILRQEALIAKDDKGELVGELIFSMENCELEFLAIHPSHRKKGIATNLIRHMFDLFPKGTNLKVITYREGDVKGIAARKLYESIGFTEGKLITVFNYPCQELNYIV